MPVALANAPTTPLAAPFVPPANYREFLAFDFRYIYKFLKSRRCPKELFEDFEQSLHTHLMSIGKTGASRGHVDKLAEYAPNLRGNATTVEAWADWLNMILSREYGKLIKRNGRGGVRGENVVSISDGPMEHISVLTGGDRDRLLDKEHQTMTAKMFVSSLLDYIREEAGEMTYQFAKNLQVYDNATEVARIMGLTPAQTHTLRVRVREIGNRYVKGC